MTTTRPSNTNHEQEHITHPCKFLMDAASFRWRFRNSSFESEMDMKEIYMYTMHITLQEKNTTL